MYIAAFIFEPGGYDEEFHLLNDQIKDVAESLPGFIGSESWQSTTDNIMNSTYYWEDEASLKEFSRHPRHLEAKRQYARWYEGYQVIISKLERSYGDGRLRHFTLNDRTRKS